MRKYLRKDYKLKWFDKITYTFIVVLVILSCIDFNKTETPNYPKNAFLISNRNIPDIEIEPTPTSSLIPTFTKIPTEIPTNTLVPTETSTNTFTQTNTTTPTNTFTYTNTPTNTFINPSNTPTPTETPTDTCSCHQEFPIDKGLPTLEPTPTKTPTTIKCFKFKLF